MPHLEILTEANIVACKYSYLSFLPAARDISKETRLLLSNRNSTQMMQNLSGIWSRALVGQCTRSSYIVFAIIILWMTEKRQKATKVRCKHDVYYKTVKICGTYHSLEEYKT